MQKQNSDSCENRWIIKTIFYIVDGVRMPKVGQFDLIQALPQELSFLILSNYLDVTSICKVSQCCKAWNTLINNDAFWKALCHQYMFSEKYESLNAEPGLETAITPAQANPAFDHSRFESACRYKRIFAYAFYANKNWRLGRYSVGPVLRGHCQQITALGCSDRLVVTGSEDGSMNVYDLTTAQLLYTLSNQAAQVTNIIPINSSGNPLDDPDLDPLLITSSLDGHIRTFDATFGMLQSAIHVGRPIVKMIVFADNVVVIATSVGSVELWNINADSQGCLDRLNIHQDEVECLAGFGNRLIASGGWDKKLNVIRFQPLSKSGGTKPDVNIKHRVSKSGKPQHAPPVTEILFSNELHDEAVTCCCFANEKRLVSGSADGTVRFWDVQTARCVATGRGHQDSSEVYCLACCIDTNVAASGASDSAVCIWSLDRGSFLRKLVGDHVGIIRCISLDPHKLISASDRKRVVVWDYRCGDSGKQLQVLHRQPILVSHVWLSKIRLVVASPEKPGAAVVLSFW